MAQVRLEHHEAEGGYLPPVCMKCGEPATCQRRKRFQQNNQSGIQMKTWLVAPFCDAHRGDWLWRAVAAPVSFVLAIVAACAGVISAPSYRAAHPDAPMWLMGGALSILVAWIILVSVLHYTSIRVSTVSASSLVVQGVADTFQAVLEQHRQSPQRDQPLALEGVEQTRRQVRLFRDEVTVLPAICVCCGEPAVHRITRKVASRTRKQASAGQVAAFLMFGIWGLLLSGALDKAGRPWQVPFPVCEQHRNYWRLRLWIILGGFVLPLLGLGVAFAKLVPQEYIPAIFGWSFMGLVVWGIVCIFVHESGNKAGTATENSLVLRNVPRRFVDAVEEQRRRDGLSPMGPPLLETFPSTDIQSGRPDLPGDAYGPRSP